MATCKTIGLSALPEGAQRYLVEFASIHAEFRLPEFKTVTALFDVDVSFCEGDYSLHSPYLLFDTLAPKEHVKAAIERCMSIKYAAICWGYGTSWETCIATACRQDATRSFATSSFKFEFEAYNKKVTRARKQKLFKVLAPLKLEGKVDLEHPEVTHCCIEDFGSKLARAPDEPLQVFLGTYFAFGCRHLIEKFTLKTRNMIGNTSMDPELSFIMANMVKARPGTLALDPFCGTASLLLPAAHFGSHVMGGDIAFLVIHGIGKTSRHNTGQKERGPKENIQANFEQYGLRSAFVDVMVADAAKPCFRSTPLFDAIIADPPYGIREPARRIGGHDTEREIPDEFRENRFPRSEKYQLGAVFKDLLRYAAASLVLGGRISMWMPEVLAEPFVAPAHASLALIASSRQPLGKKIARRMMTYEKVCEDMEESAASSGPADEWAVRHHVFTSEKNST